ncbi:IscS subfamily cysteine desulfurase [Paenalcaligenes niemegkensis]|uniref:IscS subfamily cysteine desulfurase n=1 Tax=Paenalcaligenes niemegkensis TaxID=2895469 RepID=UPI001EE8FD1E|nr:IscS subfamily cysteine desulfurase [Paenalcaligenes niemegkensis]MCQ9616584.1 IscS subfamily cysteine desulfurase [Paenalcaligenes niemegkensis]
MSAYPIYLDYSATTPVDPRVLDDMLIWLQGSFGNPASSSHRYGWDAEEAVEKARAQVAAAIGAQPRDVIWTSGATESNNLAIKGVAQANALKGKHIITLQTEHKAVLDTCKALEFQGFEISYLPVQADGLVDLKLLETTLRPDTILVSVMLVNNEIGVVQDIPAISALCRENATYLHVDAAQAIGKIPVNVDALGADLLSMSAHKAYGPKGIGALYARRKPRVRLEAQIHGGGHERGLRSGTLPTHQIVGMGKAFELATQELDTERKRISGLQARLITALNQLPGIHFNGSIEHRVPHNLNISVDGVEGEALIMDLSELALSSGSACTSASLEPSYVLKALGRTDQQAYSSLRISLGRDTTDIDIDTAISAIQQSVRRLRELSPLWDAAGNSVQSFQTTSVAQES